MNKTLLSLVVFSAALAFNASALRAGEGKPHQLPPANTPVANTPVAHGPVAHDAVAPGELIITIRRVPANESLPELGARLYDKVDYELRLRELNTEIKLTEARLDAQRERTQFYDKNFGRTPALLLTRQNAHLAELTSELRLKDLRKQKQLLLRHRQDHVRFRRLVLERGDVEVKVNE